MYLTFVLVELLLFISATTQETVSDDPDSTTAAAILETKTADENNENPTTIQSESNVSPTETLNERSDVSEDLEAKTTLAPEESTVAVEKRSGRTEPATEVKANAIEDENKMVETESVVTIPTTVSDIIEEASEFKDQAHSDREAKVSESYEDQNSSGESLTQTSHMNPNTIIDVKSRSGLAEVINEHPNNVRRFDLGHQAIQNIRNSYTTNPMDKIMNGVLPSDLRQIKSYEHGIINEMLPYYTGKPISQYANVHSNAYTMNTSQMGNRIVESKKVLLTDDSKDHVGLNINARPIYNPNLHHQYHPSYGNNHVGYYKPLQTVVTETNRNYNAPAPHLTRIPLQTISSKEIFPDLSNRYTTESPLQILSKNLGLSGPDGIIDHFQKQPDIYRKLILDKYFQNYRPLSFHSPELGNLGQKTNSIERKNPTYYPRINFMQENYQSNPHYMPIPVNNHGG